MKHIIYRHPLSDGKIMSSLVHEKDFNSDGYVFYKVLKKKPLVEEWVRKEDLETWIDLDRIRDANS